MKMLQHYDGKKKQLIDHRGSETYRPEKHDH